MKVLLVVLLCSSCVLTRVTTSQNKTSNVLHCDYAKKIYRDAGHKDDGIYSKEQDANLPVCGQGKTCCTAGAEKSLLSSSEKTRKGASNPLHHLKEMFQVTRTKFKEIFQNMMNESQSNLHSMFENTYKTHYTNNAYIIDDLYKSLQQYINGGELDLKVTFDTFFGNLHEKIYVMFKPYLLFDKKYKNCIKDNTNSIQPFGDKQKYISFQMTRAFEASRVFLQGLKEGMDVTLKLMDLPVHDKCKMAFMKMTQCSICYAVNPNAKPCGNYCLNVMKGCYAYIVMIQPRWNLYINSMVNLVAKLKGPFNMEALVVPLGVQISEAIMTFQENNSKVTHKVEATCGKLAQDPNFLNNENNRKSRKTRSAEEAKKSLESLKVSEQAILNPALNFQKKTQSIIDSLKSESQGISSLEVPKFMMGKGLGRTEFEKLLTNTRQKLKDLKDYWFLLPKQICTSGIASENNTNCWNGNNVEGYKKPVVSDTAFELFNSNPEMELKDKSFGKAILHLDQKLKAVIAQINSVTEGRGPITVVDTDQEESGNGISGTGDNDTEGSGDKDVSSGENTDGESGTGLPTTKLEGSGEGSGGESSTSKTTKIPIVPKTTATTTINNNVNPVTDKPVTLSKTTKPCNPNDLNCLPPLLDDNGNDPNRFDHTWKATKKDPNPGNAGSLLTTNLLLIALSALAYLVL